MSEDELWVVLAGLAVGFFVIKAVFPGSKVNLSENADDEDRKADKPDEKTEDKKDYDSARESQARVFRCPHCSQRIRISLPLEASMLRCSKCLSFAKVEIDQEGHLYIEKATVHESNTVPDTVEGCLSKLGVHANATSQEIKQAYRKRMQEYHPDKVAHLGPKLRELAAVEAQVLNSIYELLRASGRLDGSFRS